MQPFIDRLDNKEESSKKEEQSLDHICTIFQTRDTEHIVLALKLFIHIV